jgi:hypothetical protein
MISRSLFPGLSGDPPRLFLARQGGGAPPAPAADFSLSGASAVTAWNGAVAFGDLVPSGVVPGSARFVLVGEPAGLAVVNG